MNGNLSLTSVLVILASVAACGADEDPNATDITNVFFTKADANCSAYVGS